MAREVKWGKERKRSRREREEGEEGARVNGYSEGEWRDRGRVAGARVNGGAKVGGGAARVSGGSKEGWSERGGSKGEWRAAHHGAG
jgi:hypothetical protein